jgi:hypothetical protein
VPLVRQQSGQRWLETNSAYPFLLNCFEDYHCGVLSKAELVEVFKTLENFVLRRAAH